MKAQSIYANAYLQALPARAGILRRLNGLSSATAELGYDIRPVGRLWFYRKRLPGEPDFTLYVRDGVGGPERLLIDPNAAHGDGKRYSLSAWRPSFDGRYVSYCVAAGGGEIGELRVVDVASGRDAGERIDRVLGDAGRWLPGGRSFLYNRLQRQTADIPESERRQRSRIYLHVLGTSPDGDRAVFGAGVDPAMTIEPASWPEARTDPAWTNAFIVSTPGTSPNIELYAAPVRALTETPVPWRKVVSLDDDVSEFTARGDNLFLVTYKDAPRSKVVRTSLADPNLARATPVFPTSEAVVLHATAQADALYVETLDGGNRRIWRVAGTGRPEPLALPYPGAAFVAPSESSMRGVNFSVTSWTRSSAHFQYRRRHAAGASDASRAA